MVCILSEIYAWRAKFISWINVLWDDNSLLKIAKIFFSGLPLTNSHPLRRKQTYFLSWPHGHKNNFVSLITLVYFFWETMPFDHSVVDIFVPCFPPARKVCLTNSSIRLYQIFLKSNCSGRKYWNFNSKS